jgi:hypothetical protein
LLISIFIECHWFHAIVNCVEEVSVNTATTKATVRVDFAKELDAFILLRYSAYLFELAAKEPQVADKATFTYWRWRYDEINQQHSVKVAPLLVTTVLFDPAGDLHQSSLQQTQVVPAPYD